MSNGISNFQIEEAFKNIGNKDINDNFVGVFPSNYMNKFIDHKMMISDDDILFGTEQMMRTDNKITLVNIRFNLNACKNLSKKELDALSDTAGSFFHFIQAFGNKLKLSDFVNIWMVKDRVQDLNSVTCEIFQIYFYNNLFNPEENSKTQNKKRLNKNTMETLLNELFVIDNQETNEATIRQYANERNITVT